MKKQLLIGAGAIAAIAAVAGISYGASRVIDATCSSGSYDPEIDDELIDEDDAFEDEHEEDDFDEVVSAFADAARDAGAEVVEF